ncbi:hypothetical protein Pflav_032260 [Phytohabitans flavus]|uniref:Uncharacterized protein n=1 Tax=Phytohabitans flavus TaxID=1076124 RepID=A0A6F8XSM1_9ACTN|nr:hypothetical protein [Phytohabitans flavus]BCB76816.1 hypothetical protein Pflav_032260 [Phytohabitans flavus]
MTGNRLRRSGELALPGAGIGLLAGLAALGLALLAGQPVGWSVAAGMALGLPLALIGGGFGLLQAGGVVSPGVFAPAALYWLVGFPVARLLQEVLIGPLTGSAPALPPDVLGFLAYQAIVSLGFAIGFSWLHERIAPGWLRRIRHRNPGLSACTPSICATPRPSGGLGKPAGAPVPRRAAGPYSVPRESHELAGLGMGHNDRRFPRDDRLRLLSGSPEPS